MSVDLYRLCCRTCMTWLLFFVGEGGGVLDYLSIDYQLTSHATSACDHIVQSL